MKISVVTATFNSASTVGDTLESILRQNYKNYEVLVVDGASTDGTYEIIKNFIPKFEGRLKWHSEPDKGLYDAMNKGIAMATGDVVGILNSDDFYASADVLQRITAGMEGVDAVYGDLDFVDPADTRRVVRRWRGSQHTPGAFLKGWHPAHPTFYARRALFGRFGGFDISFNVSADFELMLRFLEKGGAASRYLPFTFVKMRTGGESTGSLKKIVEGNRNVLRAFRKNGLGVTPFYLVRRLGPKILDRILRR